MLRDDLIASLRRWYRTQSAAETLVIVGGGEVIDAIRRLDRVRPGDPAEVHWRCVDLLQVTFKTLCEGLPEWASIATAEEFDRRCQHGFATDRPTIVAVGTFYHRGGAAELPEDWRTTTDAIAAYLAHRVSAEDLMLLKSCHVESSASLSELAARGVVDSAFPAAAEGLPRVRARKL